MPSWRVELRSPATCNFASRTNLLKYSRYYREAVEVFTQEFENGAEFARDYSFYSTFFTQNGVTTLLSDPDHHFVE